jgi:hypothetical protein
MTVIQIGTYYLTHGNSISLFIHIKNYVIFINTFYLITDGLCPDHIGIILPLPQLGFGNAGESIKVVFNSSNLHERVMLK